MPVNLYYTQKVRGFQQEKVKYSKESVEIRKQRFLRYCAVCFCNSLFSKWLHKTLGIKVGDQYLPENLQRFLFKHTLLRDYVILY